MNLDTLDRDIDTERLVLRPLSEADLDDLFAVHGDDDVTHFLPSRTWTSRDDALAWLARHHAMHDERRVRRWVLVDRTDGRRIGDCMLFNFEAPAARAEIGFVLGRADWGRSLMREAAGALIATAFEALALRRIEAFADPQNGASDRLLRALGFVHEGTFRQRVVVKGEVRDSNAYGLLRDEWERLSLAR